MWILKNLSSGVVYLKNSDYNATATADNSPTQTWWIITINAEGKEFSLISRHYNEEVLRLFDNPKWTNDPLAVVLAVGGMMSYRWQKDHEFVEKVIDNMGEFRYWEGSISVDGPLGDLMISLLEGLKRSSAIKRSPLDVIIRISLLEPFIKDDWVLTGLVREVKAMATAKSL